MRSVSSILPSSAVVLPESTGLHSEHLKQGVHINHHELSLPLWMAHINALQVQKVEIETTNTIACATISILQTVEEVFVTFTIGPKKINDTNNKIQL